MKLFPALAALSLAALPGAALAQRMGYDLPTRGPQEAPQAAPVPAAPPVSHQPAHRPYRPAQPDGYIHHSDYRSFPVGHIHGYTVWAEDNGYEGTDRLVVNGPEGQEHIYANCNISREWNSWGSNSREFVHSVVSRWCRW